METKDLKSARGYAKASVTKKVKEISELISSGNDVELVNEKSQQLRNLFKNFEAAHEAYHRTLLDEELIRDSLTYFGLVSDQISQLQENVDSWATALETSTFMRSLAAIEPDDSASNVSVGSRASRGSDRSSVVAARARAAARKAVLEAEATALRKMQELEDEEHRLKQRRKELEYKTAIAKAEAEEEAYAKVEAEEAEQATTSVVLQGSGLRSVLPPRDKSTEIRKSTYEPPPVDDRTPFNTDWRYEGTSLPRRRLDSMSRGNLRGIPIPQHYASPQQELERLIHCQQEAMMALTLPQQDLPVFDGNPLEYSDFVRAFENIIEKKTSNPSSRLYYLLQYTKGQVRELVRSCLSMRDSEGYKHARKLLKEKYGQSYKIASALMDKLSSGPPIKAEDGPALERFSVLLTSCSNTLREIGYLSRLENPDGLKKIVNMLPFSLRQSWRDVVDRIIVHENRDPTVNDLKVFVENKARAVNHPIFGQITSDKGNSSFPTRSPNTRKARSFATETEKSATKPKCPACTGHHWLSQCEKFKAMKLEDRLKFVRENKLCMNCLTEGHFVRNCTKRSFCRVKDCTAKHSTYLHQKPAMDQQKTQNSQQPTQEPNQEIPSSNQSTNGFIDTASSFQSTTKRNVVSLPIVPVKVKARGELGEKVLTYALLDSGSNTTFCTDSLLKTLKMEGKESTLSLTTLQQKNKSTKCSMVSLEVLDLKEETRVKLPEVFSRPNLPVSIATKATQEDLVHWPQLKGIELQHIDAEIGLLIGNDVPELLEPKEIRTTSPGGPFATRTVLGWVLNGPLKRKENKTTTVNFIQTDHSQLSKQFEEYCNLEFNDSRYDPRLSMSQNDRKAMEIMSSTKRLVDGHYEMALPWKTYPPNLSSNKPMAERRLNLLKKRLQREPLVFNKYKDFMDDLLTKNYARKVAVEDLGKPAVWYLPHHPVFHPQKPDKVRVVFDCSAKNRETSLNDQLLQGPDLTNSLVGVLTRFRQEPVALMSDIESMFYQVRVRPSDCDYLRFLWWPDGDLAKEPEEYQMLVHLFGGASSPSCANFALKSTANDNKGDFDATTIQTVEQNFYVDDCLRSVATVDEGNRLVSQLTDLLKRGGFRLTKWMSNSKSVIDSIPQSERAASVKNLDFDNSTLAERALGVRWNVQSDTFSFKIASKEKPATRRGILSIVSSVYDPLGFVSPCILPAKAILQDLCLKGLGWDDAIPESDEKRWKTWVTDLPKLEQFAIPRCFKPPQCLEIQRRELHHFSDASTQGYGAATYLRQIDVNGQVYCSLLVAKSRLAPLKTMTIPRLELSAAVLATRLDRMMLKELTVDIASSTFWTDSTCVLRYIENKDKRFQTFVANRVTSILDQSAPQQWRYVDTDLNPADEASRGMSIDALLTNERWIQGPPFLQQPEHAWPQRPSQLGEIPIDDPEIKKTEVFLTAGSKESHPLKEMFERFSSWVKLKKITAYILRFKENLRKRVLQRKQNQAINQTAVVGPINVTETRDAEIAIVKYVQQQSFQEELTRLNSANKQDNMKKRSDLCKLDPILVDGVLRVGGRLQRAPIEDNAKHPIILPKKHRVVKLIIDFYHDVSGHSGTEYTLSLIRQKFWIVGARQNVRNVVNTCFDCRKRQAPVMQQKMASLPENRITPSKPPFNYTGVDCFGPFTVRRGRTTAKRYGVLFTCLTIRAVHIEVASSLDTESFINALRRFVARRGQPEEIRSDNGGNFVKGERELREAIKEWNQDQIHEFLLQRNIKWIFNPPAASHHGGVWERCIRTVRKVMKALLREQQLDDEGLSTLMCEIESIVNGRPITKTSDDPRDLEPLTPNHLLLLRACSTMPPGIFTKDDVHLRRRWRQVQYLSNIFWARWKKEYLPSLQQRQKWNKVQKNLAVNDIVLLMDENTPRNVWPLGRVLEVYSNPKDGLVRSAMVKTKSSMLKRPIDKIVLLESAEESSECSTKNE